MKLLYFRGKKNSEFVVLCEDEDFDSTKSEYSTDGYSLYDYGDLIMEKGGSGLPTDWKLTP